MMSAAHKPFIMIRKRSDFLAANRSRRFATKSFVLLVHDRRDGDNQKRLGITVTKKIGNAVVRNRMKRRFRALARECLDEAGKDGTDHILIGRIGGVERDYTAMRDELSLALRKVAQKSSASQSTLPDSPKKSQPKKTP